MTQQTLADWLAAGNRITVCPSVPHLSFVRILSILGEDAPTPQPERVMSNKTDHLVEAETLIKDLFDAYRRADYHLASEFQDVPEQWEDWRPRNATLIQRVEAFMGPWTIGLRCPTCALPNLTSFCSSYDWLTWPDPMLTPCRLQSSSSCQTGAE